MSHPSTRVLFILHTPPPVHGSSMVGQFIKDSKAINNKFDCRFIDLGTSVSVDEIGKKRIKKIFLVFSIFIKVLVQLIIFRPHICYFAITAKGLAFYKDALIALLVKAFKTNIVYHFHNKGITERQDNFFDNFLYKAVLKKSNVILLSKYLYPDIQKYVSKKQIFYCPNGVPDSTGYHYVKNENRDRQLPEILFLSNLIESKGVFLLLEACKILTEKGLLFHCTFVGGEGDLNKQQFQKKVNDLDLNYTVHYAGKRFGDEKFQVFSHADIFAFPTFYHNECFPLVLLEAMQYSLPVVSTFEGGIPDIVEDGTTGFLVQQGDSLALAEKLGYLILNPRICQEMGRKGRGKYEQKFTLEGFYSRIINILEQITNKMN